MTWILMGHIRVGKTTIINKLCDTKLKAGWSKKSLTRGLFKRQVAYGNFPISLVDTPGDNSNE